MDDEKIKEHKELVEIYRKSRSVAYGSPDQFQYRQNELLQKLAEFILRPFFEWERNQGKLRHDKWKEENVDTK